MWKWRALTFLFAATTLGMAAVVLYVFAGFARDFLRGKR